MKRIIKSLSILLGLCILCTACGTKIDNEVEDTEIPGTEVPTTEETVVDTHVIEPGNIHQVVTATDEIIQPIEMGKTMLADLDGDGKPEMITVRSESDDNSYNQNELHFQINDSYYHGSDFGKLVPGSLYNLSKNAFYLVDLDISDRYREILINGDDFAGNAYFLRYNQGELIPISGIDIPSVSLSGENISIYGDGTVRKRVRVGLFESRGCKRTWNLIDANCFHTALQEITEFYEYSLRPADNKLTLSQEMTFFAQMDGKLDNLITLPPGTAIDVARFYSDTGWIQFLYDGDTKEAWMKLIGDQVLLPMNIYKANIDSYIAGFSKAG